jgi:hypothetical protein
MWQTHIIEGIKFHLEIFKKANNPQTNNLLKLMETLPAILSKVPTFHFSDAYGIEN